MSSTSFSLRRSAIFVWLAGRPEAAPVVFLVVISLLLTVTTHGFLEIGNLRSIVDQVAVVGVVALAVNLVILSGEIDVSVGSLLAACAYVFGNVAIATHGLIFPLLASLAVGCLVGSLNGLLVTVGRVPSIITTLGMLLLLRGLVLVSSANGVLIAPQASRFFGVASIAGIRVPALILLAGYILFGIITRHTTWGRDVLATGSNRRAARAVGLRIRAVRFLVLRGIGPRVRACGCHFYRPNRRATGYGSDRLRTSRNSGRRAWRDEHHRWPWISDSTCPGRNTGRGYS